MDIGIIGLGSMGTAIADRLLAAQHTVFGYDIQPEARDRLQRMGGYPVESVQELAENVHIFWIMVPAGKPVDTVVNELSSFTQAGAIIVDGGNSKFTDSAKRALELKKHDIYFLDCGTSGGLQGQAHGFSLMVGGEQEAFDKIEPIFKAIAAPHSYALVGPGGAGHYVKMIHNGIEYALLQSYAEGFQLLKEGRYKNLDLAQISGIWQGGAVIRSHILGLIYEIFKEDQSFTGISGKVGQTGMGAWTVEEAHKDDIHIRLIEDAVEIRDRSEKTGGTYATKLVALLRNKFGGHPVE